MQDMGPSNPANPWTGGWTETLPLGEGGLDATSPLPGTNTLGTEGPTILTTPLEDEPVTFGLEFPLQNDNLIPDVLYVKTRNVDGGTLTSENALDAAVNWLGEGYREIAPGVFRSDERQFRMTESDLTDPRQGPHVHFESIGPDSKEILENSHVRIIDP